MVGQVQDMLWGHNLRMDCCLSGERGIKQNFDLATRWVHCYFLRLEKNGFFGGKEEKS